MIGIAARQLMILITLTVTVQATGAGEPTPEAAEIIEALQLREAAAPISDNPRWRPKRVLVGVYPRLLQAVPDYVQQLRSVAGDIELVIDDPGSFDPDAETLKGIDGIIGFCRLSTMEKADPGLLWLHSYSVGMDRCAGLSEERLAQTVFTNTKRLSGPTIAEHAMAMLLGISRGLPLYLDNQSRANWDRSPAAKVGFGELAGKTLLVAGLGGIGTQVAWRAHGLGMRVIATRNSSRSGPEYVDYVGLANELHKLAGEADVIVNALPLTAATTDLFDKAFFAAARPGAIFISVGRGKSTVTEELVAALKEGKLYGAGLDVTDPEPLPPESPLWAMPNVIISPHVSAAGLDSARRGATIAIENLRRYATGEPLLNTVNMRAGY